MKKILIISILLTACGGSDGPLTWGDVSDELAAEWCARKTECNVSNTTQRACELHEYTHLCELDGTCDVIMPEESTLPALEACLDAIPAHSCDAVYIGYAPDNCWDILDMRPRS